ncbi:MAG: adenylyltransferase/cytidyltransferase family protein, partial [Clostridia bacterium]|nr:adenylyltransferase/cytidyltransferase family protein [Clostridia bacterium]
MSKVGILGGTFDPIHTGHVMLAESAAKELKLAETLIIPAADPPHKQSCTAPFADR